MFYDVNDMTDNKKKILVVEDDRFLSQVLKGRLEREGFSVVQAFDGEEGLALLKKESPNLLLLDLITPKLSGFEVLERISLDPQLHGIPIIVASNLGQEGDVEKAKRLGVNHYYVKVQISIEDLVKMIKEVINKSVS